MGLCYIARRGKKTGGTSEQLGIYPVGNNGRPIGSAVVPENVVMLSSYVFQNNGAVTYVSLPSSLYLMDGYAFQNCTSLQELSIPDNVSEIPNYCFSGCTALASVTLPESCTAIGEYAFQNCSFLRLDIKKLKTNSLTIKGYAFSGCQYLSNELITELATSTKGTIYAYAFANLTGITEVTTNQTSNYYFSGCTNLKKATILNALSNGGIGQYIFNNCPITTVILPQTGLTSITSYAFYGRTSLANISLPNSITTIEANAFCNCSVLPTINIGENVTSIENSAFDGCTKLSNLDIDTNGSSYSLGQNAFRNCNSLTNQDARSIMDRCSTCGTNVFYGCLGITDVSVAFLQTSMFYNCTNLTKAVSEKSMGSGTGNSVFYNCTSLQEVHIADGTTAIGTQVFYGCTSLKKVYLPASITTVTSSCLTSTSSSYYVFYNCTALEDVQLGNGWNMALRLNASDNLTHDSMIAMFNNLKDLTDSTAKTLTLGSVNLAKLSDDEKAIATNKNWTLA